VFLTMVSDNILMAQSLFRLLLGQSPYRLRHAASSAYGGSRADLVGSARPFRQDPLLAGATAAQLLALRAFAVEVPLVSGKVVFDVDGPPATYQILEGDVRLESAEQAPILVSPGATFGVADTLAGTPSGWRAVATGHGRALRLDRDDLFAVMADHVDLMQNLFTEALKLRDRWSADATVHPEQQFFA